VLPAPARDAMPDPESVGLCLTCSFARVVTSRRGSAFYRCLRAETDARFARYPALPVRTCAGYDPKAHGEDDEGAA